MLNKCLGCLSGHKIKPAKEISKDDHAHCDYQLPRKKRSHEEDIITSTVTSLETNSSFEESPKKQYDQYFSTEAQCPSCRQKTNIPPSTFEILDRKIFLYRNKLSPFRCDHCKIIIFQFKCTNCTYMFFSTCNTSREKETTCPNCFLQLFETHENERFLVESNENSAANSSISVNTLLSPSQESLNNFRKLKPSPTQEKKEFNFL